MTIKSTVKPVGCRACGTAPSYSIYNGSQFSNQNNAYTIKQIENTVRVPSSEYTMNKSALNVYIAPEINPFNSLYGVNWNQMSDRAVPSVLKTNVPSHGNSTRTSLTRMRPGSTSAAGKGVDIKHGSYDRYLARLKGKSVLRTAPETIPNNQKSVKWGIAYSSSCTTLNGCPSTPCSPYSPSFTIHYLLPNPDPTNPLSCPLDITPPIPPQNVSPIISSGTPSGGVWTISQPGIPGVNVLFTIDSSTGVITVPVQNIFPPLTGPESGIYTVTYTVCGFSLTWSNLLQGC
jgi:hypothetical protein